ncbi:hypothetical protein BQ8794_240010 [Mesorhizobium prunaredense]|uniref:Uncharacterized protein n=2 Tax=Mesorhizobium TaxID=68287 RepID=A0A1R3V7F6_9HYPH|nr:conserved hypothetical protein [Mesorhizobium ventifaucium]SIT55803.1 hypothetical protein BQ8794_240010 [Mesorhizobium prunaredense]
MLLAPSIECKWTSLYCFLDDNIIEIDRGDRTGRRFISLEGGGE